MTNPEFILDVNDFKPYFPPTALPSGVTGIVAKATEGTGWRSVTFPRYLADCVGTGVPLMAYHFLHQDAAIGDQVANVASMVPTTIPVTVDVESEPSLSNWPDIDQTRAMVGALQAAGYHVPVVYLPKWYWETLSGPDLSGLPPLWASSYVTGSGLAWDLYQSVPPHWWDPYGGNSVAMLQFTDAYTTNGSTYDCSAIPGSFAQLIYGSFVPPEVLDMPGIVTPFTVDDANGRAFAAFEVGSNSAVIGDLWVGIKSLYGQLTSVKVVFTGDNGEGLTPEGDHDPAVDLVTVTPNKRLWWKAPDGASDVTFEWDKARSDGVPAPYLVWREPNHV